jgi:tRNA 2-thiouridine synthesizing protein A
MVRTLDLRGLRCPLPVLKQEAAMRRMLPGERLLVIADDPLAKVDLPHAARSAGFRCAAADSPSPGAFAFDLFRPD